MRNGFYNCKAASNQPVCLDPFVVVAIDNLVCIISSFDKTMITVGASDGFGDAGVMMVKMLGYDGIVRGA